MISVCIPIHNMDNASAFLKRCIDSINEQTYRDFEIVITTHGKMAENTNEAIKRAKGDIIKILYMDDYLAHENSLKNLADNFKGGWLATSCVHDLGNGEAVNLHIPKWNDGMKEGTNTIGSPSVIAFENKEPLFFDENMSWLLDCDYYDRLYQRYGMPTLLDSVDVVIGVGDHQMTNKLTKEEKLQEHLYLNKKNE